MVSTAYSFYLKAVFSKGATSDLSCVLSMVNMVLSEELENVFLGL
jgi:hypothetical protein